MKRPFRTGLVAGLLALTLAGAACGSGSTPEAQGPATNDGGQLLTRKDVVALEAKPRGMELQGRKRAGLNPRS